MNDRFIEALKRLQSQINEKNTQNKEKKYKEQEEKKRKAEEEEQKKKEQIEKEITEKYLAKFPQYKNTFKVYFCKSDDGARFVED